MRKIIVEKKNGKTIEICIQFESTFHLVVRAWGGKKTFVITDSQTNTRHAFKSAEVEAIRFEDY